MARASYIGGGSGRLTLGDFARTGIQDCANAMSFDEFEDSIEEGGTAEQIVDRVLDTWDDEGGVEAWIEQQDDFENLDPYKCYEFWKSGWRDCAIEKMRVHLEEKHERDLSDHVMWYLANTAHAPKERTDAGRGKHLIPTTKPGPELDVIEQFNSLDEALAELARVPSGAIYEGDANGPDVLHSWTEPEINELLVNQFAFATMGQVHKFQRARSEARSRGWRKNPNDAHDERQRQMALDELELFYLYGDDARSDYEPIETYDDIETALRTLARMPKGHVSIGDGNGPHYAIYGVSPTFDFLHEEHEPPPWLLRRVKAINDELVEIRRRARKRKWAANPPNPYEVRSSSGLEGVYADPDDANAEADELRRSGARDVEVKKRVKQTPRAAHQRKANPDTKPTNKAEASMYFYDLLKDDDPQGMEIAQDVALEYGLSLVELSKHAFKSKYGEADKGMGGNEPWWYPTLGRGLFSLVHAFTTYDAHPAISVMWSVSYDRRIQIIWDWRITKLEELPMSSKPHLHRAYSRGTFRTYVEAERAAAADAWAVAKFLKNRPRDAHVANLIPQVDNIVGGNDDNMVRKSIAPVPAELYEHRSTRKSDKRTYAQAQDAAIHALRIAGWSVNAPLRIPYATSPNGLLRLWFKPQAVYASQIRHKDLESHYFKNARSISYGIGPKQLPDMRSMSGSEFVAKIRELYPKTLGGST